MSIMGGKLEIWRGERQDRRGNVKIGGWLWPISPRRRRSVIMRVCRFGAARLSGFLHDHGGWI